MTKLSSVVAFWLLCLQVLFCPQALRAQDAIFDPQLTIKGPKGQVVICATRYFNGQRAEKTTVDRIVVDGLATPLLTGYTGISIELVVPTSQPMSVTLSDGDRVLASETSQAAGNIRLTHGSVPADDRIEMPRALPDQSEQRIIRSFIDALVSGKSQDLVSTLPIANVDWPTLDAYIQALWRELGSPIVAAEPLDGWITWDGSLNSRVLSGQVVFENGNCSFRLMVLDGQLVDVEPESTSMPGHWFEEQPESIDVYVEQGELLTRALFAGHVDQALSRFAPQYQDQATEQFLAELSDRLRTTVGSEVQTIAMKRSVWTDLEVNSTAKRLNLDFVVTLANSKRYVSRTSFAFSSGKDKIGRGRLADVRIVETWASAAPQLTEITEQSLRTIAGELESDVAASEVHDLLHPTVAALISRDSLAEFIVNARLGMGTLASDPDLDLWSASSGPMPNAVGEVQFSLHPVQVQISFAEGKLIGITLMSDTYAVSTLGLVPQRESTQQLGIDFWEALFNRQTTQAYGLLAPSFRARVPLVEFVGPVSEGLLADARTLKNISFDTLRLSNRLERPFPVCLSGYFIAEFGDGSYQPVTCEFHVNGPDAVELISFTTEVETEFPAPASSIADRFFTAFLSGEASQVVELTSPQLRSQIDSATLQAFVEQVQAAFPEKRIPTEHSVRVLRIYTGGTQGTKLQATLPSPARDIPIAASFQRDNLETFLFSHPKLASFVENIHDTSGIEARIGEYLKTWLAGDISETRKYLVSSLRTPAIEQQLTALRSEAVIELGEFQMHRTIAVTPLAETNQLQFDIELQFADGSRRLQLVYDVDAFRGFLSAVRFIK